MRNRLPALVLLVQVFARSQEASWAAPAASAFSIVGEPPDSVPVPPARAGLLASALAFPLVTPAAEPPSPRLERAAAVGDSFRYDPGAQAAAPESSWNPGTATLLDPFVVREDRRRRIAAAIDGLSLEDPAFTLSAGGRLATLPLGPLKLDLGLWRHDAYFPDRANPQRPEFDLLRFRW